MEKRLYAYVLSTINGTVQIGDTIFQIPTREKYKVSFPPPQRQVVAAVLVPDKSWESAKKALGMII